MVTLGEGMKTCPYCAEPIREAAIKCRYCMSDVSTPAAPEQDLSPFVTPGDDTRGQPSGAGLTVTDLTLSRSNGPDGATVVEVGGTIFNPSHSRCGATLEFSFATEHGTQLDFGTASIDDIRAWALRNWRFLWDSRHARWVSYAYNVQVTPTSESIRTDAEALQRLNEHERHVGLPSVPLSSWKGRKYTTKAVERNARCVSCDHRYSIPGPTLNHLAFLRGAFSRLGTWITVTEHALSYGSEKTAGRRIAAGNEVERDRNTLNEALLATACPNCLSLDVFVVPPAWTPPRASAPDRQHRK